jgi:hypothetical protein
MRRIATLVVAVGLLAGCESLGLGGGKLGEEVKVASDPGLFAQTKGEGKTLKVIVKDADGVYQQDARVIVDVGAGGTLVKVTDNAGEAVFADIELKSVNSIKVEKTEKTRKAGS